MWGAVEALPRAGVAQPEIRAAVHHQGLWVELVRQRRRMPMGKGQKNDVMAVQQVKLGGFQHPLGQGHQMWMVLGQWGTRARGGGQCADRQSSVVVSRMSEQ